MRQNWLDGVRRQVVYSSALLDRLVLAMFHMEGTVTVAWFRIFIYTILPLLVAAAYVRLDKSDNTRERRLEVYLIYLFALGVAAVAFGDSSAISSSPMWSPNPSAGKSAIRSSLRWRSRI